MRSHISPELQHYAGSFLLQTAMMSAMTLIPFFCFQHLGGHERSAAVAYGVQTLSLGITCFVTAPLISRWRNGLLGCLIGALGFGVFYCLAGFTRTVAAFCILTGIAMSFFALAWPALQSWIGAQPDVKKRTRSFSFFNIAIGLGLTAGPLVSGLLYSTKPAAAFFAVLVLSIAAAGLLFTLPAEKEYFESAAPATSELIQVPPEPLRQHSEAFLYCGWLTNMLGWGLTGAVRTVYAGQVNSLVQRGQLVLVSAAEPLRVFTAQHGPGAATLYSMMQTALSLGYFAAILLLGRTLHWQHRLWVVAAFESLLGVAIWTLASSRSLVMILLCHATMGAFTAFGYLGSQCYSAVNRELKHRRIAINEGLSQSSGFVLPLVFAQCATTFGAAWPFRNAWLLLTLSFGLQLASLAYGRRQMSATSIVVQSM